MTVGVLIARLKAGGHTDTGNTRVTSAALCIIGALSVVAATDIGHADTSQTITAYTPAHDTRSGQKETWSVDLL